MPQYRVTRRYAAARDGQQVGGWAPGAVVTVDAELAGWVNRDSPGTLEPEVEAPPPPPPTPAPPPAPAEPDEPPAKADTAADGEAADADEPPEAPQEREGKPARNRQHRAGRTR